MPTQRIFFELLATTATGVMASTAERCSTLARNQHYLVANGIADQAITPSAALPPLVQQNRLLDITIVEVKRFWTPDIVSSIR